MAAAQHFGKIRFGFFITFFQVNIHKIHISALQLDMDMLIALRNKPVKTVGQRCNFD